METCTVTQKEDLTMKSKKGFTLIELIIVIMLTIVVLAVIFSIFFTGNRVFSKTDVKSTLQMEGQNIQEELTKKNMQGVGVSSINGKSDAVELNDWCDEQNETSVDSISIKYADVEKESGEYKYGTKAYSFILSDDEGKEIKIKDKNGNETVKKVYKLLMEDEDGKKKILSYNVTDFIVKPHKSTGITLNISLLKHCWTGNEKYDVDFDISFRNRDSHL